ncbi:nicotinate (nicotinamide) nucleotide adenylyltransferase [Fenollaria massiliensis]|uniref:Probable nicotinate-nucleotide adenylyltransferase n=1 Tax=Fenollaria massiliensis TaxID=938288 RepID=A0A9E7IXA6_9FIRM|nr:nicotinate (nicotinamide) nucleotide adenylyltransferase [Fenollaria massiliensis]UQK59680.1 nicotinate (nicotinamide) nucleotide adenylyltransferase [Fenollaria massiliensis]
MKNKILIFGGTFNPIHNGHLILAENSINEEGFDKVVFIPTMNPYYKDTLDFDTRLKMLKMAIKDNDKFAYSSIEKKYNLEGKLYLILQKISKLSDDDITILIGSDSLMNLDWWYKIDEILKKYKILVLRRDDEDEAIEMKINEYKEKYGADIKVLNNKRVEISSSMIREMIKEGKSIKYLVTDEVEKFIKDENLYV